MLALQLRGWCKQKYPMVATVRHKDAASIAIGNEASRREHLPLPVPFSANVQREASRECIKSCDFVRAGIGDEQECAAARSVAVVAHTIGWSFTWTAQSWSNTHGVRRAQLVLLCQSQRKGWVQAKRFVTVPEPKVALRCQSQKVRAD